MQKNGFLTLCFSFIPGAGQMYQGYMKRGVTQVLGTELSSGMSAAVSGVAGIGHILLGVSLVLLLLQIRRSVS